MTVDAANDARLAAAGDEWVEKYADRLRPAQEGEICAFCLGEFEPGQLIDRMFVVHLKCLESELGGGKD